MIRYVRKDRLVYAHSSCKACGSARGVACNTSKCLFCGTPQCSGNGGARGQCSVCYHGHLPGWWRPLGGRCGYAKCDQPVVGTFPRKGPCCRLHGLRILGDGYMDEVAQNLQRAWEPVEVTS